MFPLTSSFLPHFLSSGRKFIPALGRLLHSGSILKQGIKWALPTDACAQDPGPKWLPKPHVRLVPVCSAFSEGNTKMMQELTHRLTTEVEKLGVGVQKEGETGGCATDENVAGCFLVLTGGTEQRVLDLIADQAEISSSKKGNRDPILLFAHPHHNSFPAALEILARLRQGGRRGDSIVLLRGEGIGGMEKAAEETVNTLRCMQAHRAMCREHLGIIGTPSDWLVASMPEDSAVNSALGCSISRIPLTALTDEYLRVQLDQNHTTFSPPKHSKKTGGDGRAACEATNHSKGTAEEGKKNAREARDLAEGFLRKAKRVEVERGEVEKGAALAIALRSLVDRRGLTSLTLRCFDLIGQLNTTGCLALSNMNDAGVISGCEGDVPTALTMLLLSHLTQGTAGPPFMANPQDIDTEKNTAWFAHCTIPRFLTPNYDLHSHFESGSGVGVLGKFPPGEVTVARVGGVDLREIWWGEGKVVESGEGGKWENNRCLTQVGVKFDRGDVGYFLREPLGNHHVLMRGRWGGLLETYRKLYLQK
eukprot:comp21769_c0_seq1/m.30876 comp21769_c0_seq1/g.30876  ORF comp21769_c0_seq1/g.30876 comp21769_c0_seq1/m.30876 type:complete len:534 (-) comp21769_c0_seq1:209-1810(-)